MLFQEARKYQVQNICNPGMNEICADNREDNEVKGTRLALTEA